MRPLDGVVVTALEHAVAAPLATRHLADLGARVIKLERPAVGDFARSYDRVVNGLSSYFVWLNRSKESVTLDLKAPEAGEVLNRLIGQSDVLVQNLAPGALDRLGFAAAVLRRRFPRLIICNISGYGSTGPYSHRKVYDLLVQSETGLVSINGTPDTPCKVPISVADISAGMYAFAGVLAALIARSQTGDGCSFEVSLFDALGEWMGQPAYVARYADADPARTGASHGSIAPYGPFPTAGGRVVYMAVQNDREWRQFCERVIGRPALADDPRFRSNPDRMRHRSELDTLIADWFAGQPFDHVTARLDAAGIAHADTKTVREFLDHPQLTTRARWASIESTAGPLAAMRPPLVGAGFEPAMGPVPALGQHTDAVLGELGFDEHTVQRLRTAGAV